MQFAGHIGEGQSLLLCGIEKIEERRDLRPQIEGDRDRITG